MHVLITGASKGIGLAIAKRFADGEDVSLSLCSRNASELAIITQELEARSKVIRVLSEVCDVSLEADVTRFVKRAEERFGPIDVLVNNAGYGRFGPVHEMKAEDFDGQLATNLRGAYLVTQAALPGMKRAKSGTIITISSLAGKNGFVGGAAYCASKFGVRGLMQSLFLDVREFGLRVVTIFPGSVDTDFFNSGSSATALRSKNALHAEDVARAVFSAVALPGNSTISALEIRPTNPKG